MLILASASPRRRELLAQAGFSFQVHPAHINEDLLPNEEPVPYVTRLAREKALAIYHHDAAQNSDLTQLTVLGADTTVFLDNHILGKPEDAADAARMLRLLSGRSHQVATGFAVVTRDRVEAAAEITTVEFLPLSESEIEEYILSGEPMDKAGAYGIQGRAARWIPRIEGCYFNVVGLPIARVTAALRAADALRAFRHCVRQPPLSRPESRQHRKLNL
jgi:septum formation protein